MKLFSFLLLILIFMAVSACLLPYAISIKDPKIESPQEYNPFLSKLGADTSFSYQIKNNYRDSVNKSPYAFYNYKIEKGYPQSTTQIIVFDSTGNLFYGYDTCFGLYSLDEFFDSVPFKRNEAEFNYNMNDEMRVTSHLNLISKTADEKRILLEKIDKHEFTVFIHYVKYNGALIKKIIKDYNKHITKNNIDAFTIYMNMATRDSI